MIILKINAATIYWVPIKCLADFTSLHLHCNPLKQGLLQFHRRGKWGSQKFTHLCNITDWRSCSSNVGPSGAAARVLHLCTALSTNVGLSGSGVSFPPIYSGFLSLFIATQLFHSLPEVLARSGFVLGLFFPLHGEQAGVCQSSEVRGWDYFFPLDLLFHIKISDFWEGIP